MALCRCDPAGIRTQDPYIKSVLLYQLSYGILDYRTQRPTAPAFRQKTPKLSRFRGFSANEATKVAEYERLPKMHFEKIPRCRA